MLYKGGEIKWPVFVNAKIKFPEKVLMYANFSRKKMIHDHDFDFRVRLNINKLQ